MYSGLHDPEAWALPYALREQTGRRPDRVWITSTDGDTLTFAEANAQAAKAAGFFAGFGIDAGRHVGVMLHNSCDFVRVWLALAKLGAIAVHLNTELRAGFLRHQIENSGIETLVIEAALLPVLDEILAQGICLKRVVVVGSTQRSDMPGVAVEPWLGWRHARAYDGPLPRPQDIACIMYTSGTSGPAKGVLMPHRHCALYGVGAIDAFEINADDRYYIVLPLFHANGLLMQLGATLLAGIPAVLKPRFSATTWLSDIRTHEATLTNLLGALAAFVLAQPETPRDRDHKLRALLNGPNIPDHEAEFRRRFGIRDVLSGYGMTEVNIPVWGKLGRPHPGAAGWVDRRHFDVMIANPETDAETPPGEIGEILVRPKIPFGFMAGYYNMPDRTVEAWRNLWFHSGDAGKMDSEGLVTFVDRIKDCIRRRGENISAAEVEQALSSISGVEEIAAYAVPSDIAGGEDEVMLAIVLAPNSTLSLEELAAQADPLLPRFARPRFMKLVESLPKTATGKVQRAQLRSQGITGAWDRSS